MILSSAFCSLSHPSAFSFFIWFWWEIWYAYSLSFHSFNDSWFIWHIFISSFRITIFLSFYSYFLLFLIRFINRWICVHFFPLFCGERSFICRLWLWTSVESHSLRFDAVFIFISFHYIFRFRLCIFETWRGNVIRWCERLRRLDETELNCFGNIVHFRIENISLDAVNATNIFTDTRKIHFLIFQFFVGISKVKRNK